MGWKEIRRSVMKIKIPHSVIVKSPGLLPMLYKVSELSEELNIHERTLRDWLSGGAPHQTDSRNHVWVNGTDFHEWVLECQKKKTSRDMKENDGWCLRCKKPVEILNPQVIANIGQPIRIHGVCSICGGLVNRGVKKND
jgi:hypothetical protein